MVGKVKSKSGLEATFHEDWTWTVTVPKKTPPEVATLTKQFLELVYRPSDGDSNDPSWVLYHFACYRNDYSVVLPSDGPRTKRR